MTCFVRISDHLGKGLGGGRGRGSGVRDTDDFDLDDVSVDGEK